MSKQIILRCCCCAKQAVDRPAGRDDYITTLIGAKAGFKSDEVFCGHCAKDLDENGLFSDERAAAERIFYEP